MQNAPKTPSFVCPLQSLFCPFFLLRCERCGHVVHLDCGHLHALYEHLEAEHHFRIDPRRTILTGLCQACAGKEDAHGTQ